MTNIAINVAIHQGTYSRPDAKQYMNDTEHSLWLLRQHGERADLLTARTQKSCKVCPLPIVPGQSYYSITTGGGGLASLKFPDRIHTFCLKEYCDRRRQQ